MFWATFEQLLKKLRETFWKISSNLWKALIIFRYNFLVSCSKGRWLPTQSTSHPDPPPENKQYWKLCSLKKDQEKRPVMTKKRTSPKHESTTCLESTKQRVFMLHGDSPTAFVFKLVNDRHTEKKYLELLLSAAFIIIPFYLGETITFPPLIRT